MSEAFERLATNLFSGFLTFVIALIVFGLWDFIWAVPVMLAWNYVMPHLFGFNTINYLQTFCLLFILTSLWKVNILGYDKK